LFSIKMTTYYQNELQQKPAQICFLSKRPHTIKMNYNKNMDSTMEESVSVGS